MAWNESCGSAEAVIHRYVHSCIWQSLHNCSVLPLLCFMCMCACASVCVHVRMCEACENIPVETARSTLPSGSQQGRTSKSIIGLVKQRPNFPGLCLDYQEDKGKFGTFFLFQFGVVGITRYVMVVGV